MKGMISRTEYILKEAKSRFRNPAVLWSTGKDSTAMLSLMKNTFFGKVPFPVVHLDTGKKFREMYEFRKKISEEWNLDLIIGKNEKALIKGISPERNGHFRCCNALKTEALKIVLKEHGFDALIMSIRRDEHVMRNIERFFSPRDSNFEWHIVRPKTREEMGVPFESLQPVELWDLYQTEFGDECSHVRVHPILHWTELDVWKYIQKEGVPVNPLYLSRKGKRYRSLGCECCTRPVRSYASDIDEIIKELETTRIREREGRTQDKEDEFTMRRLRSLGYM